MHGNQRQKAIVKLRKHPTEKVLLILSLPGVIGSAIKRIERGILMRLQWLPQFLLGHK